MGRDLNAAARLEPPRQAVATDSLTHDFVSDVVVYQVEGVEPHVRKPRNRYAERYLGGDIWFKVFLNVNTDGHFGKYIATITSSGPSRRLDDARDNRRAHLIRQQMQTRVLEAIVQSAEDSQRVTLGILPSLVGLDRVDHCSCLKGEVFQHGVVPSDLLGRLGLCAENGKGMLVGDSLSRGFDRCTDDVIQDGPQVMDGFVREQLRDVRAVNYLKAVSVVRSIGIYLTAVGQWVTRYMALDQASQMAEVFTCPAELEPEPCWWRERIYCRHGQEDSEDPQGPRNPRPLAPRSRRRSRQDGEASQETVTGSPPEEVAPRTDRSRRSGGYSATRTHSGSPEDASGGSLIGQALVLKSEPC